MKKRIRNLAEKGRLLDQKIIKAKIYELGLTPFKVSKLIHSSPTAVYFALNNHRPVVLLKIHKFLEIYESGKIPKVSHNS